MLLEGRSGVECARHFGVSESAISQAKRYLRKNVLRTVGLDKVATVVAGHMNILGQVGKANRIINEQLDAAVSEIAAVKLAGGDPGAIRAIVVKLAAEIRMQTETYLRLAEAWRDFQEWEIFKNEILNLVARLPKEYRDEFETAVKEKGLLPGSSSLDPR